MKKLELIEQLKNIEGNPEMVFLYDTFCRADTTKVYLSKRGEGVLTREEEEEDLDDIDRPVTKLENG